jgi:hypothetical protein
MANIYSPADFQDADAERPANLYFDMTGTGVTNAYSLIVDNVISKAVDEIKHKHTLQLPTGWKKRLRDFMATKHEKLLDCIKISASSHPTLSRLDILHSKFTQQHFFPSGASLKTILVDLSAEDVLIEINGDLEKIKKETPLIHMWNSRSICSTSTEKPVKQFLTENPKYIKKWMCLIDYKGNSPCYLRLIKMRNTNLFWKAWNRI